MTTDERMTVDEFMRQKGFTVGAATERVSFMPSRDAGMATPKLKKAPKAKFETNVVKLKGSDAPMEPGHRSAISAMAGKCFKLLKITGWTADDWRHDQCVQVIGKRASDPTCTVKDFLDLKAHFELLMGDVDKSLKTAARAINDGDAKAQMMFKIEEVLCGLPPRADVPQDHVAMPEGKARPSAWGWANAISKSKFQGATLNLLSVSQLQHMYLFLQRAVAKKRKAAGLTNAKKASKAVEAPKVKAPKPVKDGKQGKTDKRPNLLPCYRCGDAKPIAFSATEGGPMVHCPACNTMMEGNDLGAIVARWNRKERKAAGLDRVTKASRLAPRQTIRK